MELTWAVQTPTTVEQVDIDQQRINASRLILENIDSQFCYIQKYKVLICRKHATAILNVDKHLTKYHTVPAKDRRRILDRLATYWIEKPEKVALPPPMRKPIEALGKPLDGLRCTAENCTFVTVDQTRMRKHCKKEHGLSWKEDGNDLYSCVKVQTFFSANVLRRYFIVQQSDKDIDNNGLSASEEHKRVVAELLGDWKSTQEVHENQMQVMDAEAAKTDRTGWFNRTGWPDHLASRNLKYLAHAIRLPDRNEQKLKEAAKATELLIQQSIVGLSTLPRETRRWLKSAQREEVDQRPFGRLQNPESQARYASYIVKFVCYFLRIVENEEMDDNEDDDSTSDSDDTSTSGTRSGSDGTNHSSSRTKLPNILKDARELFKWQGRQKELAKKLWDVLDTGDKEEKSEALLEVLASFVFESTGNDTFSSGLIHFLAVLGIDSEMGRLRTAKNYSYMLAGVVYCIRVIAIEALLPSAKRQEQEDADRVNFLYKRRDFLADGSFSPMSEILSVLAYGKFVAMNQGNSGNAYWSQDKKIFYLNGRPIYISHFQEMAREIVTEAEDMLWEELLWIADRDQRFTVDLEKIVDDVTFTKRGISFIHRKENKLDAGLQWMLGRTLQISHGRKLRSTTGVWKVRQVRQYLRRIDTFLELLLFGVHQTSGQPGRGTEVTTMRRVNGVLQDRNIFVIDGQVVTVVRYHKSQSQWDKPKVVPRFLPWRLGQVMVVYLAYLQPFYEYLNVKVLNREFSDYLWANERGPWDTDHLTRIIKCETGKRLGTALTTLDYRHTAVSIGRVVVGEGFGRGYQDEVGEIEEAEMDEDGESALELQNSRTTRVGIGNYGVPINIIKDLSIRSIEVFRPLSSMWHDFLGLSTNGQNQISGKGQTKSTFEIIQQKDNTEVEVATTSSRLKRGREASDDESSSAHTQLNTRRLRGRQERINTTTKDIYTAMRVLFNRTDVEFKSIEQEQAMYAVIQGQTPLVVVLPTGGGKSLLFMVPSFLDETGVTVVVVPYRALINDLVQRMKGNGIDCIEWKPEETNPAAVVIVSADFAGSPYFLQYAVMLSEKKLLRRVVIDECHMVVTSSNWRPKLAKLRNLRVLLCPIILLTATLPPVLEQSLSDSMNIRGATYIRASTVRPNIRYMVSWCKAGEKTEMAIAMCRRQQQRLRGGGSCGSGSDSSKAVIYCSSKQQCETIAEELGCGCYHSEVVDRAEQLAKWLKKGGFITATSALGTGVDYPGIVFILHVGMPWSMIDFAQESGRAGRGGEVADSIIIVEKGEVERTTARNEQSIDVQAIGQFIQASGCRRGMMSGYLDGKRVDCSDIESAGCDRCGEGMIEWQQSNSQWAGEWERVRKMMDRLQDGCVVCWFMGDAMFSVESEHWLSHSTGSCKDYKGLTSRELDGFRRYIRYGRDSHSCMRCGVSQVYCNTKEDIRAKCQWGNFVVPLVRAAVQLQEGLDIIRQCGYTERLEGDYSIYGRWLGQRHNQRIWGESFSNAMVVCIRIVLLLEDGI